jgi:hypothetical protein
MPTDKNRNSVLRQVAALQEMPLCGLKEKWKDLYGCEAPNYGRQSMIRHLAYRIQELFYGGLKKDVKEELRKPETAELEHENRKDSAFTLGTRFIRVWNKKEHEVSVVQGGFEYEGRKYRSLTAVAEKITGSHWNGRKFFGVPGMDRKSRGRRMKRKVHNRKA